MKKKTYSLSKILENPFINLIVSIGLIAIGIEELYKDVLYVEINWKHGISFYGILMCIQASYKIINSCILIYKYEFIKDNEH